MTRAAYRGRALTGFAASFVLHAAVLALGGYVMAQPVRYAVEAGSGGIEIHLVAAPAPMDAAVPVLEAPPAENEALVPALEPEDVVLPEPEPAPEPPRQTETAEPKNALASTDSTHVGDGSSLVPGQDPTTFHSAAGALSQAKPDYLRNPAPAYPWVAREKGWQGVVILAVEVDSSGRPSRVEVEQSSGYDALDESALRTVRKWRFRSARIGTLPVASSVRVPIRFELDGAR